MTIDVVTKNLDIWSSAIKRRNSQGRGSSKKIELYGIKKLRELILELAVRGVVGTGGFTKEARYEAERAKIPMTLVDIDDLAELIVVHYESFDLSGRALIPLVRIYWPAE